MYTVKPDKPRSYEQLTLNPVDTWARRATRQDNVVLHFVTSNSAESPMTMIDAEVRSVFFLG